MAKKVNLYKWHRMKKKLISSVISILCCLAVMAVGVYASTTAQFETTISNDLDIKISVVDGTLYAKRKGGVYGEKTQYGSAGMRADVFGTKKAGASTDNLSDYDFLELYNQNTTTAVDQFGYVSGVNGNLAKIQGQKLDINVYNNRIEYVFKYIVDVNNGFPTIISMEDKSIYAYLMSDGAGLDADDKLALERDKKRIKLTYSYIAGGSSLAEPTDWDNNPNVLAFPVKTGKTGEDTTAYTVSVGGNTENGVTPNTCIYIRCLLEYNTTEYAKDDGEYNSQAVGDYNTNYGMISDNGKNASLYKKWAFKLNLVAGGN